MRNGEGGENYKACEDGFLVLKKFRRLLWPGWWLNSEEWTILSRWLQIHDCELLATGANFAKECRKRNRGGENSPLSCCCGEGSFVG